MSSRLAEFILKNNVSGIQKTFRTMLEQHLSNALRKQVITENEDATPLEPQIINILITAAHESNSHNYKYETGLFSADFNLKSDVLEFIEFVNDYYWVRHYEVDMEINDSMTSIDMESLPDDAEGNFSVHVTIDSSIIRYPKGYVTEKTDIDCNEDDYITEAAAKRTVVFRDGKKTTVMQCPPGHIYNAASKKCRKMSTTELKNRHKAGLKAARELKSQIPAISKKRNKTDKLRRKALKIHAMAKTTNQ